MIARSAWANRPIGDLLVTSGSPQGNAWDLLRVEPVQSALVGEPSKHVVQNAIRRVG